MQNSTAEQLLMSELKKRLASTRVHDLLFTTGLELLEELRSDPGLPKSTFRSIPLSNYGGDMPEEIGSSWVFALRKAEHYPPERHPESVQRMFALMAPGYFDCWDGARWVSRLLVPGGEGLSIPADIWHRLPPQDDDWVVVSFHTAEPDKLTEIVGDPETGAITTSRVYLAGQGRPPHG